MGCKPKIPFCKINSPGTGWGILSRRFHKRITDPVALAAPGLKRYMMSHERLGADFIPRCFTLPLQHWSPFVISLSEPALAIREKIVATNGVFDVNPFALRSFSCFINICSKFTGDNDILDSI